MTRIAPLPVRLVNPEWMAEVASPPYDALSPAQRREHLVRHPASYLGVTRSEADLPEGSRLDEDRLLADSRRALDELIEHGAFGGLLEPAMYAMRLGVGGHSQTGVLCGLAADSLRSGELLAHERVHDDRLRVLASHLEVVGAQSSPIVVAHEDNIVVGDIVERAVGAEPSLHYVSEDGLELTLWAIETADAALLAEGLADHPLYMIDGHHRAGAAQEHLDHHGPGPASWMLAVLFPAQELRCESFHRWVEMAPAEIDRVLDEVTARFDARPTDPLRMPARGEVTLHGGGRAVAVVLPSTPDDPPAVADLAAVRLQHQVLGPLVGVVSDGSDPRLAYLPGVLGAEQLRAQIALKGGLLCLLPPVTMTELFAVADAGLTMPPKSTYFVPKARSGLVVRHL